MSWRSLSYKRAEMQECIIFGFGTFFRISTESGTNWSPLPAYDIFLLQVAKHQDMFPLGSDATHT